MNFIQPRFRIYQGIACLEDKAPPHIHAGKWWDQGFNLNYTPYPIKNIRHIRIGIIQGTTREVIAAQINQQWIVINPARSDIPALEKVGIWPTHMKKPYSTLPTYTPWPEKL
ncbi:MAG: hypothetical protein OXR68_08440 [Alphaproteobacteria bacterium]|nr:hypothetical protein [Alphaproteobacteria bacterium]MDD9920634.1 hypothetical protein [Alphaproteobacteria bacterium]